MQIQSALAIPAIAEQAFGVCGYSEALPQIQTRRRRKFGVYTVDLTLPEALASVAQALVSPKIIQAR